MTDPNTEPRLKPGELTTFLGFNRAVLALSCDGAASD